jgi:phosphoglycolate phosphatase-like HAD superfamily hydrolase
VTPRPAAILDIDGTLVDTNYHHAVAWFRAFRRLDVTLPIYRIHRHIGMGSDQLVGALAGDDFERAHGDEVRALESDLYMELIEEVRPLASARELLEELKRRGHALVLASSAKQHEVDHYLDLLDARELADGWTTSADVENTKPEPDLVAAAVEKAEAGAKPQPVTSRASALTSEARQTSQSGAAVMVGDSTWDCEAAKRAGLETIGVLTGGFSGEELREAGAACVFERLEDLGRQLDGTPLSSA